MTTTTHTVPARLPVRSAAWAGVLALLVAVTVAAVALWPSSTVRPSTATTRPAAVAEAPTASADAVERRAQARAPIAHDGDARRFGSADAAERWSGR